MATVAVKLPDIGDFTDVEVVEVMVKPGDKVKVDDSLITIESEKASMEVPSSETGVVKELKVKVGDRVSEGSPIVVIETDGGAAAVEDGEEAKPAAQPAQMRHVATAPPVVQASSVAIQRAEAPKPAPPSAKVIPLQPTVEAAPAPLGKRAHASPAVRKFARELGVDLTQVGGTGMHGRVFRTDVEKFVKAAMASGGGAARTSVSPGLDLAPWPKVDFTKYGEIETRPLSRIRRASKTNLWRNWVMIPHVTQFDDADITDLEAFRNEINAAHKNDGVRVTLLAFVLKALVQALREYPEFNSTLDGDNLILKKYFHFGFAADTADGLVVPVIRDVDKKGVLQIARETAALAATARDGKLKPTEMQGGCFTVSSLGGIGGSYFSPIINAPEVAVLGVSRVTRKPVWRGDSFVPRLIVPLSLSYDHRVIDGALAARFITYLGGLLADMRRALL